MIAPERAFKHVVVLTVGTRMEGVATEHLPLESAN